jgi:hypothetical protein
MRNTSSTTARTLLTLLVLLATAGATAAGCKGRERRPILVQAPTTNPAGRQNGLGTGATGGTTGVDPLQNNNNAGPQTNPGDSTQSSTTLPGDVLGATTTTPSAPTLPTTPGSGGGAQPGGNQPGPQLAISTQLEDGTQATLQWDTKSFKGNDKWDVIPQ